MKPEHSNAEYRKAYVKYGVGLGAGLVLVYLAYFAVVGGWFRGVGLAVWLLVLAAVQFVLQLVVFLHVGDESKPKWTLWSIVYTVAMLLIIVVASLWIMANMNYNMHATPEQMHEFMLEQNKKGF